MAQPQIIVTSLDMERLERLLSEPAMRALPGVNALEAELERADVVEPTEVPSSVVTMNSRVRFLEESTGQEHEMTLVYPRDAGSSPDRISVLAPVGSALLGLAEGQTIEWSRPGGGTVKLRVLKVVFQPEAAQEFHR